MAVVLAAALLVAPVLPKPDGIDQSADEVRLELAHQIREHRAFVRHVKRERRQEAQEAAQVAQEPPAPVPSPTYQGGWSDELRAAGFPESAIPTMLYIIDRESGGDPSAVNGGGPAYAGGPACGLTQLYPCPGPEALDPMTNLRYAYEKYQASGFAPWSLG